MHVCGLRVSVFAESDPEGLAASLPQHAYRIVEDGSSLHPIAVCVSFPPFATQPHGDEAPSSHHNGTAF